ncbi:hypothetical protein [Intestinibacter sp.]|uniref:hypothetical protein n=1 Tax=Intestinibacter sp. TaxID=1965304 RepID=UPI002A757F85|nr:hypothetical protein [Intestinibacter sp.]MDY2734425.1 hypothetical protein [Intestinibacter sp.]
MNMYQRTIVKIAKDDLKMWGISNPTDEEVKKAIRKWKYIFRGRSLKDVMDFKKFNEQLAKVADLADSL